MGGGKWAVVPGRWLVVHGKWAVINGQGRTVGCVWNFQIGGGSKSAIFQFSELKFDIVPYFGLINSPTGAKIFSCKNGFLSLICIKLTRDTALKPILLDLLENSTPL